MDIRQIQQLLQLEVYPFGTVCTSFASSAQSSQPKKVGQLIELHGHEDETTRVSAEQVLDMGRGGYKPANFTQVQHFAFLVAYSEQRST